MIATLRRRYEFEAAHRLPHVPEGHKCGRMHGHSYRVTVVVRGPVDPATGMVCDFAEIDAAAKPIIASLDHRTLNEIEGLENPTSENLAAWLIRSLRTVPHLRSVEVSETLRGSCVVDASEVSS